MAKKTETNKTWIIVSLIIGAAILGYGLINYKYKMKALEYDIAEKQRTLEQNEAEKKAKANSFVICMNGANKDYETNWNAACKAIGQDDECSLPSHQADSLEESRDKAQDICVKLYGN